MQSVAGALGVAAYVGAGGERIASGFRLLAMTCHLTRRPLSFPGHRVHPIRREQDDRPRHLHPQDVHHCHLLHLHFEGGVHSDALRWAASRRDRCDSPQPQDWTTLQGQRLVAPLCHLMRPPLVRLSIIYLRTAVQALWAAGWKRRTRRAGRRSRRGLGRRGHSRGQRAGGRRITTITEAARRACGIRMRIPREYSTTGVPHSGATGKRKWWRWRRFHTTMSTRCTTAGTTRRRTRCGTHDLPILVVTSSPRRRVRFSQLADDELAARC